MRKILTSTSRCYGSMFVVRRNGDDAKTRSGQVRATSQANPDTQIDRPYSPPVSPKRTKNKVVFVPSSGSCRWNLFAMHAAADYIKSTATNSRPAAFRRRRDCIYIWSSGHWSFAVTSYFCDSLTVLIDYLGRLSLSRPKAFTRCSSQVEVYTSPKGFWVAETTVWLWLNPK